MLAEKHVLYFDKTRNSIKKTFNNFEKNCERIILDNRDYDMPSRYNWEVISEKYLQIFKKSLLKNRIC